MVSHEVGETDVECPLCKREHPVDVKDKDGKTTIEYRWCDLEDGKDNEHTHMRICPCCGGTGFVNVYVGEIEIDMSDFAPDRDWYD
jgi:hypothetical protein